MICFVKLTSHEFKIFCDKNLYPSFTTISLRLSFNGANSSFPAFNDFVTRVTISENFRLLEIYEKSLLKIHLQVSLDKRPIKIGF
jgi:hypothetical protein